MATRAGTYLPIRPAGYKPAPVPYFKELMTAQNMLPVGILAAAASAGDDDKKKKPAGVAVSTPAVPPPDEDPLNKLEGIKTLTERVISQEVEKLPGGQEVKQLELFDDLQEIAKIRPKKSRIDEKVIGEYFPDENYGLEENIDWAEALDRSQADINNFVDGLIKGEVDFRVNQYIEEDKLVQEHKEEMFVGDEPLEPKGCLLYTSPSPRD